MELITIGRNFYPGYRLYLYSMPDKIQALSGCYNDRFRVVLIESGSCIAETAGKRYVLTAPMLFCLNEQDDIKLIQQDHLKIRTFFFHPFIINSAYSLEMIRGGDRSTFRESDWGDLYWFGAFLHRDSRYSGILSIGPATAHRLTMLMDTAEKEMEAQKDESWPCRTRTYFFEILFLISRVFQEPKTPLEIALAVNSEDIGEIILYLHTNYMNKITVEDLAHSFHTNRTTLQKRFFDSTGLPIMAYLIQLRMRLASLMLRDTTLPVNEIMFRVGFNDSTHFGRTFKKFTNLSPSEYREEHCWILPPSESCTRFRLRQFVQALRRREACFTNGFRSADTQIS